ncbi:MAG: hypothetical protein KAU28_10150, partial [Phycisphaerae bacterium]|nr:hypothetical protein [Phycisphaerae bacterium]
RFDQKNGYAYLDGPGRITRPSGEGETQLTTAPAENGDSPKKFSSTIMWSRGVVARFREEEIDQGDLPAGDSAKTRLLIDEAKIHGDVEMIDGKTGNFVRCDELHVFMAREGSESYPTRAVATGNVFARQDTSDIKAQRVIVNFAEPSESRDAAAGEFDLKVKTILAAGDVRVTSQREGEPVIMTADELESDLEAETALVRGAGTLLFRTTRGPEGEELDEPRDVKIAWSQRMDYSLAENLANFLGGVKLESGSETMSCRKMQVVFEKSEASKASAATQPASGKGSMLDSERFRGMKIASITADKNVVVMSSRTDEKSNLLRQLMLEAEDKLKYDAKKNVMKIFGPGQFLAEDYRPPEIKADRSVAANGPAERAERPSQTYFTWKKHMIYTSDDRKVVMEEGVEMVHVSGKYVVKKQGVRHLDWGELTSGRVTTLGCDLLMACFKEAAESPAASSQPAGQLAGMNVGQLDKFTAIGNVIVTDGKELTRRITAHRLNYTSRDDLVLILGISPDKPAHVVEESMTGQIRRMESPRIRWYRKIDKFELEGVTGGGN